MPIFDYECSSCGNRFELLVLPSSSSVPECPSCKSQALSKLISVAAISSEHTQRRARQDGKARGAKVRGELSHEEHKRIPAHRDDHHH
jgi:putative FmdB family regulatory protein